MAQVKTGDGTTRELNVGDMVNYVLPDGPNEGQVREAKVSEIRADGGMCDLVVVLTEEDDDAGRDAKLVNARWRKHLVQNVDYNANGARRTWHF